jgi:uncharacterized protein
LYYAFSVCCGTEFEWDEDKHQKNIVSRGIGFDIASRIFEGETFEWQDDRFDSGEQRLCAIGQADDRVMVVVYTLRSEVRRIISARRASRMERKIWQDTRLKR